VGDVLWSLLIWGLIGAAVLIFASGLIELIF
jgi:hypothetical protein